MAGELKQLLPVGSVGPATKLEPTAAAPQPTRAPMTDVRPMTAAQSLEVLPSVGLAGAPQRLEAGVSAAQTAATPGRAYLGKVYPKYPPFPPCDDVVAWYKLLKDEAKGVYGPVDALGGKAHNHMCVQCIGVERSQAATKAFGNTVCQGLHVDYGPTEWQSGEDEGGFWFGKWGQGALGGDESVHCGLTCLNAFYACKSKCGYPALGQPTGMNDAVYSSECMSECYRKQAECFRRCRG